MSNRLKHHGIKSHIASEHIMLPWYPVLSYASLHHTSSLLPANNVQASMVYHSRIPVSYNNRTAVVDSLSCFLTYTATTHHYLLASILLTQFDSLPMAWITGFGTVASLIYMDINNKGRPRSE
ncbi:Uncharacterized protein HZ326_18668 [Fusarium oxysporum f. sp. albedinis]|nr:hypothetical protein HZ326_18740 [Fusarium oxysporum f. sp. albedinis]KAJ0138385.1 Uncharacterized protein HZ326_18668 [Fusarium oxysporum f. sp. albedinis]